MYFKILHCYWLNVNGMALFPFILIKDKNRMKDTRLIRHEIIHLQQQIEMLVIPFYLFYFINYAINLVKYFNHDEAYRNIIFEKEAYFNDADELYLSKRKRWAFLKYIGLFNR